MCMCDVCAHGQLCESYTCMGAISAYVHMHVWEPVYVCCICYCLYVRIGRSTQLPTLPTTTTTEFVGSSKLLTQTTTHKLAVTTTRAQLNAGQLSAVSLNWIVGVSVAGAALIMTGLGMLEDVYAARPCNHMLLQYYLKP
eukprot:GHVQ01007360.1.p1 GENE.GHVQ01007360.1~~GHVQ01007360.1.p1  ORF type:complete len:140 (+),score=13.72 GHVQ01007360.1:238-657(+)